MKLTKTEDVKVYEFNDGCDFEWIAAFSMADATQYMTDMVGCCCDYKIRQVPDAEVKKTKGFLYVGGPNCTKTRTTAAAQLKKSYKETSLPFVFWIGKHD